MYVMFAPSLYPDFLLFCVLLMIAITITDLKMRPPIFLQGWVGRGFRARLREENNVATINHLFHVFCERQSRQLASFTDFTWSRSEKF